MSGFEFWVPHQFCWRAQTRLDSEILMCGRRLGGLRKSDDTIYCSVESLIGRYFWDGAQSGTGVPPVSNETEKTGGTPVPLFRPLDQDTDSAL